MKDKEMIEEMANCFKCVCKPVCMKTADVVKEQELVSWNEYIKQYGCKHYQPKLPKDSVVLSREEYEKLIAPRVFISKKELTDREITKKLEMSEFSVIQDSGTIEMIPLRQDIEKETAEKILMPLYDACKEDTYGQVVVDFSILENLAKQFGVEVKE